MLSFLAQGKNAETLAFAADLFCVWISAVLALRVPRLSPRLFTALVLFVLNWGILLLYYLPGPPQNEILSAFSGFLLLCAGLLLARSAREELHGETAGLNLLEKAPLYLFRATVGGFGVYLVLRRLFRWEYGYGTLAIAAWGTLLTVLDYGALWLGLVFWYRRHPAGRRLRWGLGAFLALYCLLEIGYCAWYAEAVWPPYHRFLVASTRAGAPDYDVSLPLEPRASWPEADRWRAAERAPNWADLQRNLVLRVEPQLPEMPVPLKYGFSVMKLLLTGAVFGLLWRRPEAAETQEGSPPVAASLSARVPAASTSVASRPSGTSRRPGPGCC